MSESDKTMMMDDEALNEALRHDRTANPAPRLGGAVKATILARVAENAVAGQAATDLNSLSGRNPFSARQWGALRAALGDIARPTLWRSLTAAAVAGVVAGTALSGPLYSMAENSGPVSVEEEFISYLGGDALKTFLDEEDA